VSPNRSFYIPRDFMRIWEKFLQIAKREGRKASIIIRDFVAHYVEVHDPGNPQARITSYAEGGAADVAAVEGRIREYFRFRFESKGLDVTYRQIVGLCKEKTRDTKAALAMAQRVARWLGERGVKVWR